MESAHDENTAVPFEAPDIAFATGYEPVYPFGDRLHDLRIAFGVSLPGVECSYLAVSENPFVAERICSDDVIDIGQEPPLGEWSLTTALPRLFP